MCISPGRRNVLRVMSSLVVVASLAACALTPGTKVLAQICNEGNQPIRSLSLDWLEFNYDWNTLKEIADWCKKVEPSVPAMVPSGVTPDTPRSGKHD